MCEVKKGCGVGASVVKCLLDVQSPVDSTNIKKKAGHNGAHLYSQHLRQIFFAFYQNASGVFGH